jgi:transcriptional regulator with XRE-family HTH domain
MPLNHGLIPEWTLADRLRKARLASGLTQEEFADQLGAKPGAYTHWEAGRNTPRNLVARSPRHRIRRPLLYPLSYWGTSACHPATAGCASKSSQCVGAADGQDHRRIVLGLRIRPQQRFRRRFSTWRTLSLAAGCPRREAGSAC